MSFASDVLLRIKLLNHLFLGYAGPAFAVRFPLWSWHSAPSIQPIFSLIFRSSETFERLLQNSSETELGEAFVSGELDVEGNIFSAFALGEWLLNRHKSLGNRLFAEWNHYCFALMSLLTRGRKHSRRRDAASISHHYDLPVDFFEPWLGPTLLYSAAYFRDSSSGLDAAQRDKLDLICHKLDLHSGDRLMDIGCGWGTLAIHAASKYGAQVRGITISRSQARVAARRISEAHLGDCCFVEYRDYRDAPALPWRFDKLASIGMFEHVGVKNLPNYFKVARDLLKPGGAFLNSGIVRTADSPRRRESFIDQQVFPDGELPTLTEALCAAEEAGFEIRDVESFREHYARTLRLWVRNLMEHAPELLETVNERTLRTWLLYMAGSAAAFERGDISVCEVLMRRHHEPSMELHTREHWYVDGHSGSASLRRRSDSAANPRSSLSDETGGWTICVR
jgi:cyclopropane-fatty-acyl-phospholipid synthase